MSKPPLLIDIHLFHHHNIIIRRQLLHSNILANLLSRDNLLIQHRRRPPLELIAPLLLLPLIRRYIIPQQRRLLRRNHTNIHIRPGPQIIPDPRLNCVRRQLHRLVSRQLLLPLRLEHRHRRQRPAAHRHIGQFVRAAVRVHGEEPNARRVDPRDDQVGADVALVPEQVLLEHRHHGDDARLAACGEGVQFKVGGDEGGGEFGVGGCAGAGTPYLGGDVVEFFTVLGAVVLVAVWGEFEGREGERVPCLRLWGLMLLLCLLR